MMIQVTCLKVIPTRLMDVGEQIKVVKVSKGLPNKRLNGYTQAQLLHFPLV